MPGYRLILDTPFNSKNIISYGLIVYARNTQRWLLIQHRHTVEFLLIIRGLYRKTHLPFLLSCITPSEADLIKECIKKGPLFFNNFYTNELKLDPNGLKHAISKISELRNVIINLLSKLDLSLNELKWFWPKGRSSQFSENTFTIACKEFYEKTGLQLPPPLFISDNYISEINNTISGRTIESRYFLYVIENEIPIDNNAKIPTDIIQRKWMNTDTCQHYINSSLFQQIYNLIID